MVQEFTVSGIKDIEEIEKIPYSQRAKEKSTTELLEKGASINPQAPALSFILSGETYDQPMVINYSQFIGKIRQTANFFNDLGINANDVVTYVLPSLPQTHYVLWGAEAVGIANPINPLLEPATIKDICNSAKTKVLVTIGEMPGSDIWEKINSIRKDIPTLKYVIRVMGPSDKSENIIGYDEAVESYPSERYTFERTTDPDDIASLYHTGGTTGTPKLAKRSHYNEVIMAYDLQIMGGYTSGSTLLCGLPLFHCNGTMVTGLGPFAVGGHVILLSPMGYRDPGVIKNFFKIVERYKAETFSGVPTVFSMLLDLPVDSDVSSLKYAICGAAPMSVELFKRVEAHTGIKILEGYGLTEGAVASALNPKDGKRKVGSIGIRMPYQSIKTVIVDDDGKYIRDAKTNEIGAVAIGGPNVFKGYVEETHNKNIWLPDGSFNTGDLGRIDEDGYVWLTGRKKELIIRGGHNIDPAIIEEAIYQMSDVKTVAAVGRPDPYAGEVPVAYVQMAEDSPEDAESIMQWAKQHVGEKAAIPKEIIITKEIHLTPVGKIFKPALRYDATRRAYEKALEGLEGMAESFEISVGEDKAHGTRADIKVKPNAKTKFTEVKKKIDELLAPYTIYYTVSEIK